MSINSKGAKDYGSEWVSKTTCKNFMDLMWKSLQWQGKKGLAMVKEKTIYSGMRIKIVRNKLRSATNFEWEWNSWTCICQNRIEAFLKKNVNQIWFW